MVSTVSSETWVVGPGGCGAGGELLFFLIFVVHEMLEECTMRR